MFRLESTFLTRLYEHFQGQPCLGMWYIFEMKRLNYHSLNKIYEKLLGNNTYYKHRFNLDIDVCVISSHSFSFFMVVVLSNLRYKYPVFRLQFKNLKRFS